MKYDKSLYAHRSDSTNGSMNNDAPSLNPTVVDQGEADILINRSSKKKRSLQARADAPMREDLCATTFHSDPGREYVVSAPTMLNYDMTNLHGARTLDASAPMSSMRSTVKASPKKKSGTKAYTATPDKADSPRRGDPDSDYDEVSPRLITKSDMLICPTVLFQDSA